MPIMEEMNLIYAVRPGDTLHSIAAQWGSSAERIAQANALRPPITDPGRIYPGWVLAVPAEGVRPGNEVFYVVGPEDTLYRIADRFNVPVDLLAGINLRITNPDLIFVDQMLTFPALTYTVEEGDTLWRIARRFGVPLGELLRFNANRPGLSPDVIYPGFRILVPLPSSTNIAVFRPYPGTKITEGQKLEGFARAFEAAVNYQIRDESNRVVARERSVMASAGAPAYGVFSAALTFDQPPGAATGEIWVYTRSPRDGSIQDLTEVRVFF